MAKPSDLRIAVVVEEESLVLYRAWVDRSAELMNAVHVAMRELDLHLSRGAPTIFATLDTKDTP